MPFPGDEIPNVVKFFLDLQIVTTIILMQSLIVNSISTSPQKPSDYVEKFNQIFTKNALGEALMKPAEKLPQDISTLMDDLNRKPSRESVYFLFCRIIDCFCFICALITFAFLFMSLFPKGYLSNNYNPIDVLLSE